MRGAEAGEQQAEVVEGISVTVPTVERGLRLTVFWSMEEGGGDALDEASDRRALEGCPGTA
ncbi:MAG: hypothetical protein R3F59_06390 [Myxococcota bacterium]